MGGFIHQTELERLILERDVSSTGTCATDNGYRVEGECEGALQENSVRLLVGILQVPHTLFQKVAKVAKARSGSLVVSGGERAVVQVVFGRELRGEARRRPTRGKVTDKANTHTRDSEGEVIDRRIGLGDDENLVTEMIPIAHNLSRCCRFTRTGRALNKGQCRNKARHESGTLRRVQRVGQDGGRRRGEGGKGVPKE